MFESLLRTVMDCEVLNRVSVPVLKPAIREPAIVNLPSSADRGQRVWRCPAPLFQAIETERTSGARRDGREFFDSEVIWPLLELHSVRVGGIDGAEVSKVSAQKGPRD